MNEWLGVYDHETLWTLFRAAEEIAFSHGGDGEVCIISNAYDKLAALYETKRPQRPDSNFWKRVYDGYITFGYSQEMIHFCVDRRRVDSGVAVVIELEIP